MLTNPIKISIFILGLICALISLLASALLWISFATNLLDAILLGITSAAFVGASYLFIPVILRFFEFRYWLMLFAILVLEVILALSSVFATVGFLESRYQNQFQTELTGSDAYHHQQSRINNLETRIAELIALATEDREKGYRQRAERLLNKADRLSQELDLILNQKIQHTNLNAGNTLARDLGDNRYMLWTVLAVLVDGCPMACFALVNLKGKNTTPPLPIDTPAMITKQSKPAPINPQSNDQLYTELKTEIEAGHWGDKPAMRNIITDKKIRYSTAKEIFERLVTEKVLTLVGNRFERVT